MADDVHPDDDGRHGGRRRVLVLHSRVSFPFQGTHLKSPGFAFVHVSCVPAKVNVESFARSEASASPLAIKSSTKSKSTGRMCATMVTRSTVFVLGSV